MQLLENIDYGPNTFGTNEESGGNFEHIGGFSVEDEKNQPQTPLPAPHIARAKRAKKTKKHRPFFRRKKLFF
jgi:hypothetical protein